MSVFIRVYRRRRTRIEAICQDFADTYGDGENEKDLQAHYEEEI